MGDDAPLRGLEYRVAVHLLSRRLVSATRHHPGRVAHFDPGIALDTDRERYRMISFPIRPDDSSPLAVLDDLGPLDDDRWRLFRYLGSNVEFTVRDAPFDIERGKAYWLITRDPHDDLDVSGVSSLPLIATDHVSLSLTPGWNQIASPFAFPVNLEDSIWLVDGEPLRTFSEAMDAGIVVDRPLHAWIGSSGQDGEYTRIPDNILHPWSGYFLFCMRPGGAEVRIPFREAGIQNAPRPACTTATAPSWSLELRGDAALPATVAATVGLLNGSRHGLDRFDDLSPPPPPGEWIQLVSVNAPLAIPGAAMCRDLRPPGSDGGAVWELRARASEPTLVELELTPRGELPAGMDAVLIDPVAGRTHALDHAGRLAVLALAGDGGRLLVAAGTPDFVASHSRSNATPPRALKLEPVVPNPAHDAVYLRVALPSAREIDLRVFDVSGRLVRILSPGWRAAGLHVLAWDGSTERGGFAASGIYYIRLVAGDEVRTQKVAFIR
jgi:hypothetical protein